jgi:hypothetical protein
MQERTCIGDEPKASEHATRSLETAYPVPAKSEK